MLGVANDRQRDALILAALFAGGAVPIQLVTASFGYAQYVKGVAKGPKLFAFAHEFANYYVPIAYIPALIALVAVGLYCRKRYPDISRRILVGLAMGVVGTMALDVARQAGVIHGWLPADTPVMFGKMVTASKTFSVFYPVGLFVHYMNGANFGLIIAFVWGRRSSYRTAAAWGVFWLLLMELGMMTAPPMGSMVGLFGVDYQWPQLFLVTLVAHVMSGLTMGLLIHHFLGNDETGGLYDDVFGLNRKSVTH